VLGLYRSPAEPSTDDLCRLFPIRLVDCETGSNFGRREAKNGLPPTPPSLWKSFFGPSIACNLHEINSLHFHPVDESVTANPRFCPYFGLFWGQKGCKSAVFDGFLKEGLQFAAIRKFDG
jgi:hypothetical protein